VTTEVARAVIHYLAQEGLPGVALLEPLRFGAHQIVTQVESGLHQVRTRNVIVRLVPKPNTQDEKRLYSALYRDLYSGLQKELGQPLPAAWQQCFAPANTPHLEQLDRKINDLRARWQRTAATLNDLDERYLRQTQIHEQLRIRDLIGDTRRQQTQIEQQLEELEQTREQLLRYPADEETFEVLLTSLLEGPVAANNNMLVLLVEGLSRVAQNYLQSWAWLMSRLTSQFALKLVVWGGQELHELCTGTTTVEDTSPFQRLKQIRLGNLSFAEVNRLTGERCGTTAGAGTLYELTQGHPALVYELLNNASDELRTNDVANLHARIISADHLKRLKHYIAGNDEIMAVIRRLLEGDNRRGRSLAEDYLYWLGLIDEYDAGHWRWRAPVFAEWLQGNGFGARA
jgi:hypothetical protein